VGFGPYTCGVRGDPHARFGDVFGDRAVGNLVDTAAAYPTTVTPPPTPNPSLALRFGVRRLGPPCRVLKHTAPQRKPAAGSIPGPTGQRFSIGTS
jgi:hypothetical protein